MLPDERIDETVSAFYEKISTPVLTNLQLDFDQITTSDLYPTPLPDLFSGSQILLTGRYRGGGTATITLRGSLGDMKQEYSFPGQVFTQEPVTGAPVLAALPRLWATRKIGYLLSQIRLQGPDPETIEQIVNLSVRYGVITPYTSYLVSEQVPFGSAAQEDIAREQYNQMQSSPAAPVSGQAAVEKSALEAAMSQADSPANVEPTIQLTLRNAGSHSYLLRDGKWIDTAYDPDKMQTERIEFLSEQYNQLASANRELAAAFALGPRVIAVVGNTAYEVYLNEDSTAQPFATVQVEPPQIVGTTPEPTSVLPGFSATVQPSPGSAKPQGSSPPICTSGWLILAMLAAALRVWRR